MYKETYIYDKVWLYSDTEPITERLYGRKILYNGKRENIPDGLLINHGYGDGYFNNDKRLGDYVCIVMWDDDLCPIVLDSVISSAFWRNGVDPSLLSNEQLNAIKDSICDTVRKLKVATDYSRLERSSYIFNRDV